MERIKNNSAAILFITAIIMFGSFVGATYYSYQIYKDGYTIKGNATYQLVVDTTHVQAVYQSSHAVETFYNKKIIPRIQSVTDNDTLKFDVYNNDGGTQLNTQSTGNLIILAPDSAGYEQQQYIFKIKSTNVQTFVWNSIFNGSVDVPLPTTSTGSSKYDYIKFISNTNNTKWECVAVNKGFN